MHKAFNLGITLFHAPDTYAENFPVPNLLRVRQRRRARIRVHGRAVRDDEKRGFIFRSHANQKCRALKLPSQGHGAAGYLPAALAAATILSQRGSPRKSSGTD
jgi:hypothetical protein